VISPAQYPNRTRRLGGPFGHPSHLGGKLRYPSLSLASALLLAALAAPARAQGGGLPPVEIGPPPGYVPVPAERADSIRAVLRGYIDAVRRHDGAAGARAVSRGTRAYYARLRGMALTAPEAEVRALPLMDRMSVLMYRHRVPPAVLCTLEGDSAFAYTIREGWVDRTAPREPPVIKEIWGKAERAVVRGGSAAGIEFVREDGEWRWDMVPMLRTSADQIARHLPPGMTEDGFIYLVLRDATGRAADPTTIWRPVQ